MVSAKRVLLILAADRREFAGFRPPAWKLDPASLGLRWSASGFAGQIPVLLAANGVGRANALAALEKADEHTSIGAVVSTGFAGALSPQLVVGDIFLARTVLEFGTGVEYSVRLAQCAQPAVSGRLLTVDAVVQDAASKAALQQTGADAVDMEAAAVAWGAQCRHLPFYCVRVISDDARTSFEVDFNRARREDGTISGWRVAMQAGLSRRRWQHLLNLKRAGELASRNLAAFLRDCRFEF